MTERGRKEMENKNNDISANELLAKLKANMEDIDSDDNEVKTDGRKKYKFRRSGKITRPVTEEDINAQMPSDGYEYESPVPKSDIEDLDIDALMKKYLPEEDYERMTSREKAAFDEEEFVRTLSSIEIPEEIVSENEDGPVHIEEDVKSYTAPDSELYAHLSEGGKVCDVPELENRDEMSDTMQAPLRPMSDIEKTIAFGDPENEEGGFMSVREILAAQYAPTEKKEEEPAPSEETVAFDFSKTVEMPITEENDEINSDTVQFTALNEIFSDDDELDADLEPVEDEAYEPEDEFEADSVSELELIDGVSSDTAKETEEDLSIWSLDVPPEGYYESFESKNTPEVDEASDDDVVYYDAPAEEDEVIIEEAIDEASEEEDVVIVEDPQLPFGEELEELIDEMTADIYDGTSDDEPVYFAENETVPENEELDSEVASALVVPTLEGERGEYLNEEELADDEFDETDANLMLAFGMDEELDAAIGKESADKLRTEMDNMIPEEEQHHQDKPHVEEAPEPVKEFVSPTEIKGIFDNYKNEYGKSALRLFALIAAAILLFLYENITLFGGKQPNAFNPEYYPIVHVMIGFQILLAGFAILYKNVISGFKSLIAKKPTQESFLPVMLAFSTLYAVLACFFPAGSKVVSFNFPLSLSLVFFVIGQRLDLRREIMTFRIISSKRGKFALEKLDIIDAELETKAFDKFLPSQPDIFRINKTSFIDGYFKRTNDYSTVKQSLNAFIPASVVAFVIGAVIGAVADRSFAGAITTAYTAFAFALPATIFFTFSLPMFRASKVCYDDNSAIVGESALDQYTSASSISFDDREVFPTSGVKLRSIKVFGSGRLDTVIYYMASIYSCIGGPLSDVLNVATADLGRSENIEVLSIDEDGIETLVDGHHLYAGKADYLRHNGYLPVTDPEDEEIEGGDISIIFLVCDDEVVGKFYVRYRIDPEFEGTLKSLYKSGICVGIKTVDPNINDEMLSTRIRLTKYPVRVLKYDDISDRSRGSDRTDSGIVSKKSVKALLRAFTLCDKTKHITKTNLMIAALTMLVGVIITVAATFIGSVGIISSIYASLFQIFWILPVYLISKFLLM